MAVRTIQFFVIVISALAFVLSVRISSRCQRRSICRSLNTGILQGMYYGWAALEILLPVGAIASAALAAVARHHNLPLWLATLAALCFIVMLIVSFIWTFPANHATDNWMTLPKDGKR